MILWAFETVRQIGTGNACARAGDFGNVDRGRHDRAVGGGRTGRRLDERGRTRDGIARYLTRTTRPHQGYDSGGKRTTRSAAARAGGRGSGSVRWLHTMPPPPVDAGADETVPLEQCPRGFNESIGREILDLTEPVGEHSADWAVAKSSESRSRSSHVRDSARPARTDDRWSSRSGRGMCRIRRHVSATVSRSPIARVTMPSRPRRTGASRRARPGT